MGWWRSVVRERAWLQLRPCRVEDVLVVNSIGLITLYTFRLYVQQKSPTSLASVSSSSLDITTVVSGLDQLTRSFPRPWRSYRDVCTIIVVCHTSVTPVFTMILIVVERTCRPRFHQSDLSQKFVLTMNTWSRLNQSVSLRLTKVYCLKSN